ncbi:TPA: hypothetical protein ACQ71O_005129, partial [Escherichia coli]
REILISESAWEEMTCLFAPSLKNVERGNFPDEFQLQMHYQSLSQIRLQIDGVARVETLIDTKKIMDRQ